MKEAFAYWCPTNNNFGDIFTEYLFRTVYNLKLINNGPFEARLIGCGSIMAAVSSGYTGCILGTGILSDKMCFNLEKAKVFALRGELTKERCLLAYDSPLLADLGILAYLFAPMKITKKYKLGIVPHEIDQDCDQLKQWAIIPDVKIINICAGVQEVVSDIASCETIVSSCLHGLVVADSLGIPNRWVKLSDKLHGGSFKFYDYYSAYHMCRMCGAPTPLTEIQYISFEWERKGIWQKKIALMAACVSMRDELLKEL